MVLIFYMIGWPSMGLHFKPGANVTKYLDILLDAAAENSDKFDVYTPETMPERYHFAHCARIAPVYIVPKMGYVLTTRKEGDVGLSKGVSDVRLRSQEFILTGSRCRIMDTTTTTHPCARCLSLTGHLLLSPKHSTKPAHHRHGSPLRL